MLQYFTSSPETCYYIKDYAEFNWLIFILLKKIKWQFGRKLVICELRCHNTAADGNRTQFPNVHF